MDEIPDDIRRMAFTAAGAWFHDIYLRDDLASDIARLILAERERCNFNVPPKSDSVRIAGNVELLQHQLDTFGPSPDGALERDLAHARSSLAARG